MFGKNHRLIQIEMRKQLLVEESEVNRAQLTHVSLTLRDELRMVTKGSQTLASVCSSTSMLVAGLANLRHNQNQAQPGVQLSWFRILIKGAGLVSSLWRVFKGVK
jgi:hypothetical protein